MKIYTKTGDKGKTTLYGGGRISKDDLRVECYGTVDEMNSLLGIIRSFLDKEKLSVVEKQLENLQQDMLKLGSDLSTPLANDNLGIKRIDIEDVSKLETWIDQMDQSLEPLRTFILPGGKKSQSFTHLARTVCRRAERRLITLMRKEEINPEALKYLNRLSDYLFTLARFLGER